MSASAPPVPGRIFISYRREETAYPAGWLYDRLISRFGGGQVFKDIDSIQLGDDFVEVITRAVASCDVLLALIGNEWLTITDERGRRRLDDPDDFVRLEIEAALTREVRVIPILVDGARMPRVDQLPDQGSGVLSVCPVGEVGADGVEQARTSGIMRFSQPHDHGGSPCLPTYHRRSRRV
jgi:TIR domain